jgi:hypothetical protein
LPTACQTWPYKAFASLGWLFLIAFRLAGATFAARGRAAGVRWWRPPRWWELGFLALVTRAFIGLNAFDLTNWYHSAIGAGHGARWE